MEFCLVAAGQTSRWEFPHTAPKANETPIDAACRAMTEQTGFKCRPKLLEPLEDVMATQNRRLVQLVSFLLEVDRAEPDNGHKIRWCFPEEARARIRRKPMRRLIDLALRHHSS
jgi:8-oxo-dGTP pyrophosphatase MutT (NUDIX family)